jgi:tripartite-type tricarboxylate transporter receptor subunit TctC
VRFLLLLGALALIVPAHAQRAAWPDRPIRLIVPFPPGGGNDILARAVAQRLSQPLGQQVVVDNRGGAGGMLGGQIAATSDPDGYTLLLGSMGSLAHNPALRANNPYDPPRDFAGVSMLATSAFLLAVHPMVPAKNTQELLALARAKPGTLNYASAGAGSSLHMTGELFKHDAGVNVVHVAYKGTGPALVDLLAGQVQMIFSTMPPVLPHVKTGKLRALGVTTAARAKAAPDIPTIAEAGVRGFEVQNWQGIVAPKKTPAAIVEKLHGEILKMLATPAMIEVLAAQGLDAAGGTPGAFDKLIREEIVKWRKLVQAAGIRVD